MSFMMASFGLVAAVWSVIAMLRGTVFLSSALFLVCTSCCPAEFFSIDAAGLTWTLDRLWFVALLAQVAVKWYRNDLQFRPFETTDIAVALFSLWLIARTITQPLGSAVEGQPPTLMHLINGYLVPFGLYFALRTSRLELKELKPALWTMLILGGYLSVTALLEVAKIWPLVFPRFIADGSIGIHFGRARGPMLQSVRLGICLLASWVPLVIYTVWYKPYCRFRWALFLGSLPVVIGAIFCTYTRSIWLGLAAVTVLFVFLLLRGFPRRLMVFGMACSVMAVGVIKGPDLVSFKREYSAAETRESTYMRAAFAYVSMQMIKDKPISGFGFNQFQIYNQPYLSDRSTNIRLESIRGYVHHNSFLSLLVDLGIVGFALYLFVGLAFVKQSWAVWRAQGIPKWARGLGLIAIALTGVHIIQMAFHEVSFSSIENGFLFASYGLVIAAKRQFCVRPSNEQTNIADAESSRSR